MPTFYVGGDVSKGYADFEVINEAGSSLTWSGRYDDTPNGHGALTEAFERQAARDPDSIFVVGVESTGGLERNWLHRFRALALRFNVSLYHLNPLALKRFLDTRLHRAVTDAHAAKDIALFLQSGVRLGREYKPKLQEDIRWYRSLCNQTKRLAAMKNELQYSLVTAHPDLVQYARENLPQWLLRLLVKYPTAARLSRAHSSTVASIPFVTATRAKTLIAAAKNSVASSSGSCTEAMVSNLAGEILRLEAKLKRWREDLCSHFREHKVVAILDSLPGIAKWTAVSFLLEVGDFDRFPSERALIAFLGLDPCPQFSGDGRKRRGISRRGPARLRGLLFMSALSAISHSPVFRSLYARLRANGREHASALTACMAKLVRVAYACVMRGTPYDSAKHEADNARCEPQPEVDPNPGLPPVDGEGVSLSAPISSREAKKRRRATALPQTRTVSRKHVVPAPPSDDMVAHAAKRTQVSA